MKKQFDLNYYLEHPETKLVTRDERGARILCTDLKNSTYPIVAACDSKCNDMEIIVALTNEGKTCTNSIQENPTDLFFSLPDTIKKRIPLTCEDMVERAKSGKTMWVSCDTNTYAKLIIGFNSDCISVVNGIRTNPRVTKFNYSELMGFNFIDGTPCWKEVEE